jgi:hypothetical protein
VLVESYDGDLWIYDVDPPREGALSGLRVGDEVILAFDDRIAGKRAIAINAVGGWPPSPSGGTHDVADMLPSGVVYGAPAVSRLAGAAGGSRRRGLVYSPGMVVVGAQRRGLLRERDDRRPNGTVFGSNGTIVGTLGSDGTIFGPTARVLGMLGPNGTMVGTNGTVMGTLGSNGTIVGTNGRDRQCGRGRRERQRDADRLRGQRHRRQRPRSSALLARTAPSSGPTARSFG